MSASGLEERIGTLLAQHREELEQLVDQALARELETLVERRLAAGNGGAPEPDQPPAPVSYKAVENPPARACTGCGETKPLSAFEKNRSKCRQCRHREHRARELARAQGEASPEPGRPASIPVAELRERSRVDSRAPAPDLGAWLVEHEFATRVDGGLAPTAAAVELADALVTLP